MPEMSSDVAFDTSQVSSALCPSVIVWGKAANALMVGLAAWDWDGAGFTVTVTDAVTAGPVPEAVRVYVVVSAGVISTLVPFTTPSPVMFRLAAPETSQVSSALCPAVIVSGNAVKALITVLPPAEGRAHAATNSRQPMAQGNDLMRRIDSSEHGVLREIVARLESPRK
jgi:hypothetical protein